MFCVSKVSINIEYDDDDDDSSELGAIIYSLRIVDVDAALDVQLP